MTTLHNMTRPDWVRWLAQDADGTWWGFEAEPNQSHHGWYENELGRYCKLEKAAPNPDWENSLTPVQHCESQQSR